MLQLKTYNLILDAYQHLSVSILYLDCRYEVANLWNMKEFGWSF